MTVLKLVKYLNKDLINTLKCLLEDAIAGRVTGIALCYRTNTGEEESAFAGIYKRSPEDAASAAMRLSMKITRYADQEAAARH